jgi:hypothetical protein
LSRSSAGFFGRGIYKTKEMSLDRLTATMPAATAPQVEWPEHVYLYDDRFVVLCVGADTPRLPINLRKPGLHLHLQNETTAVQREAAKVVKAFLEASPPPEGNRRVGVPLTWWCVTGTG